MGCERLASLNIAECVGRRIGMAGVIKNIATRSTKNGGSMMSFTVIDGEAHRDVVLFDMNAYLVEKINNSTGKVMDVVVDVKPYEKGEDGVSCIMFDIAENTAYNIDEFIPAVKNIGVYVDTMNTYLGYCSQTIYGKIALKLLNKYWSTFCIMPGGQSQHHDLKGGLLMHSVCVAMNCYNDYMSYSNVYGPEFMNLALLLSAALIHDIGKCFELEYDGMGGTTYSKKAAIENHTMRGLSEIDKAAAELGYEGSDEVLELKHLVSSHHDKPEWGAAMKPSMIEAVILARADEKDAMVNKFYKKLNDIEVGSFSSEWSGNATLNCYYKGISDATARQNAATFDDLYNELSRESGVE